jgi:(R)-2-hydroxyglutarate---pyruvate transhydrogenase
LWALREGITEAISKEGKAYKYDISLPPVAFKDAVDETRERLRSKGLYPAGGVKEILGFGHIGDGESCDLRTISSRLTSSPHVGNLHLNIVAERYTPEITAALEPFVYELAGEFS